MNTSRLYSKQSSSLSEALRVILHTVFWGGLWTVVIVGLYQLWIDLHNPKLLPIRQVVIVASNLHVPKPALEKMIYEHISGTLLTLKGSELKAALAELPWVENVSIRRVWPAKVIIEITEQVPIARWGAHHLMNKGRELFSPPAESFPSDLPLLSGPKGTHTEVWKKYQLINQQLSALKLNLQALSLSSRHSWSFILSNNIKVILGREDVELRLERLIKLYPKLFAAKVDQIEQIDLRYPNGFAVKWKN